MLKCIKCNETYRNNEFKFCPNCGGKLENPDGKSRFDELGDDYKNVYGVWKVTTEGDCEGRSTKNLGTYEGCVDDIAFALANQAFYSLEFVPATKDELPQKPTKDEVSIHFGIASNSWKMKEKDLIKTMEELFDGRNVEIENSNYYASFKLKRK